MPVGLPSRCTAPRPSCSPYSTAAASASPKKRPLAGPEQYLSSHAARTAAVAAAAGWHPWLRCGSTSGHQDAASSSAGDCTDPVNPPAPAAGAGTGTGLGKEGAASSGGQSLATPAAAAPQPVRAKGTWGPQQGVHSGASIPSSGTSTSSGGSRNPSKGGSSAGSSTPPPQQQQMPAPKPATKQRQQQKTKQPGPFVHLGAAINDATKWGVSAVTFAVLLWCHDLVACWCVLGSVVAAAGCKVLKYVINQARPVDARKADPGMPSSHANSLGFLATYVSVASAAGVDPEGTAGLGLVLGVPSLGIFLAWLRVAMGYHTVPQVVVGWLVGSGLAAGWHSLGHRLLLPLLEAEPRLQGRLYAATAISVAVFIGQHVRRWVKEAQQRRAAAAA